MARTGLRASFPRSSRQPADSPFFPMPQSRRARRYCAVTIAYITPAIVSSPRHSHERAGSSTHAGVGHAAMPAHFSRACFTVDAHFQPTSTSAEAEGLDHETGADNKPAPRFRHAYQYSSSFRFPIPHQADKHCKCPRRFHQSGVGSTTL